MRATRPVKCAGVLDIETAMTPGSRRPLTGWRVRATEPSTITTRLSPMPAKLDMPASRPRSRIAGSAARVDPTRFGVPPFVSEAREPCAQLPHSASLPTRKCELYCVCCPWRADMQPLSESTPPPRGRSRVRPAVLCSIGLRRFRRAGIANSQAEHSPYLTTEVWSFARRANRTVRPGHTLAGSWLGQWKWSDQMVSTWWVLWAFLGGGCLGVLVMALMHMSGDLPEQSPYAPDLNRIPP